MKRALLLAAVLALVLAAGAPGAAWHPDPRIHWVDGIADPTAGIREGPPSRPAPDVPLAQVEDAPAFFSRYPSSADTRAFLEGLAQEYPHLAAVETVGTSWQGRPIVGIRLGNRATGDPDARPALYLDGQHHAREPISSLCVLYTLWWLLSQYGSDPFATHLLDTRTVYAIPSINPDGNDIWLADNFAQRRNANPTCCDDDGDGLVDEDPPNGIGWGTFHAYLYVFDPAWLAAHPGNPFVDDWYRHVRGTADMGFVDAEGNPIPQIDDDGDGPQRGVNEDPIGGVDLNRNYDVHWNLGTPLVWSDTYRGPAVWSEPETRAVRDWVLAHPNIGVAASLHSGADVLLYPWGWSSTERLPDGQVYEHIGRKASQLTECCGFLGAPHTWTARGLYTVSGSAIDWLYLRGIYAFSPELYAASEIARAVPYTAPGIENAYLAYTSVGIMFNPPEEQIVQTCERWRRFLVYLLAALPAPVFNEVAVDGSSLVVRVANNGGIAADLALDAATDEGLTLHVNAPGLRGRPFAWSLPLEPLLGHTLTFTATATLHIGGAPRDLPPATLRVRVSGGGVEVLDGNLSPFASLAGFFGEDGWDADPRRWEGAYHLGPPVGYPLVLPVFWR
ncbi:MAG: hypothetical protein Kow00123_08170 [Anaerolineales bacterium]